nr:MAG TPA: hypothetical protein [Caudoviricetes sp.]
MIFIKFLNKIIINIAKLLSYHPVWVVFFAFQIAYSLNIK